MRTRASFIAVAGLLFLFTFILGVLQSRNLRLNDPRASGKPLTGAIPTAHKLLAVATLIAAAVAIRNLQRGREFRSMELAAVIFAGMLFLLMFVTGALLSLGKAANEGVQAVHKVMAVLTVGSASGAMYLLARGRWW